MYLKSFSSRTIVSAIAAFATFTIVAPAISQGASMDDQVAEYIKKFPKQDTYNYLVNLTDGDPAKLNVWVFGQEPALVKAGDDKVVRMNNDTYYKMAFVQLEKGPVVLGSDNPSKDRFNSFQLMDDGNVNFHNVIHPDGKYVLYYGQKPAGIDGTLIEAPSKLAVVIVRVEVKDKDDKQDVAEAQATFNGITISGPKIDTFPELDLLGGFDEKVAKEAEKQMQDVASNTDFSKLVAGPGDVPGRVSELQLAAGTKFGWGGPVTTHSAYESFFSDADKKPMKGDNGTYTISTEAPPVDAFWSVTVYDTDRGGFLHPNKDDSYHINNTSAVANEDGTYTFSFKTQCGAEDKNCLEVPGGQFDIAARYYLPREPITSGKWRMPRPVLQK
jgi:hypothetical protein